MKELVELLISNDRRNEVMRILDKALTEGYLTVDEYAQRSALATEARTEKEVYQVLSNLPVNNLSDKPTTKESFRDKLKNRIHPVVWMVLGSLITIAVMQLFWAIFQVVFWLFIISMVLLFMFMFVKFYINLIQTNRR